RPFFDEFVEQVRVEMGDESKVQTGVFGARMAVEIHNDGPVTIELEDVADPESPEAKRFERRRQQQQ
ncbi:MAG: hypothetical protein MHM6MM_006430, partial [Cercozoa sp. M6MM]